MAKIQNRKRQTSNINKEDTCNNDGRPEENTEMERHQEERGDKKVNGKRKAEPTSDSSPSKKAKPSNDGFCLFVGNLNNTKTSEEIRNSLAKYFTMQNLLFQDIRLGRSKTHAFVDMASDIDLTKALALNGEEILDKPMKMAKAKVKSNDQGKVKAPPVAKKVKDNRCLFLKNVPYDATQEDIRKVFQRAIAVRFPGGAKGPTQGIAFVEFKNKAIAEEMLKKKQKAQIKGRDLIVDRIRQREVAKADSKKAKAAPSNKILFVKHLPETVNEPHLRCVFKKAVRIRIPPMKDKPKRFAFVEFATVAHAKKALQFSKTLKICNKAAKVEMCRNSLQPRNAGGQLKTLFVVGLAEKTTAETLQSAFDGAISARVAVHKSTGDSKRFGFVEFNSEECCKAAKAYMEDCEIDGSNVTVTYAVSKGEGSAEPPSGPSSGKQSRKHKGKGHGSGTSRHAAEVVKSQN
ncbi:nucleolin-like isoform X2 [Girardinichthys multiradiatus]|uniref:nucleolin-like isoform X2 n=1 Tax=Girardinichthys multiradiatus TaxID=208333 RepID=UPI001FAD4B21|nr:nucleolin-like isoform X2 [Girardinichthys multiradiatus]